jgi:hypothetical protein
MADLGSMAVNIGVMAEIIYPKSSARNIGEYESEVEVRIEMEVWCAVFDASKLVAGCCIRPLVLA